MLRMSRLTIISALLAMLAGCTHALKSGTQTLIGVDGIACVGDIQVPRSGLFEVDDNALLKSVLAQSGKGQLCAGRVYEVTSPIAVYRAWDSTKQYTAYGRWWSFDRPHGPREQYQKDNAICPEWSGLDRVSSCTVKQGTKIVVGVGQSATCQNGAYEKSATNQVYIANDSRNNNIYVENCTDGVVWP